MTETERRAYRERLKHGLADARKLKKVLEPTHLHAYRVAAVEQSLKMLRARWRVVDEDKAARFAEV
jgi:hypothetical protein